jgi:hypothetical protein
MVHKIWICFIIWKLSHVTLKIVHLSHVILGSRNKYLEWCGWQLAKLPLSASSCVPLKLPLATITSPEHLSLVQVNHYQLACEENGLMIGGEFGKCGGGGSIIFWGWCGGCHPWDFFLWPQYFGFNKNILYNIRRHICDLFLYQACIPIFVIHFWILVRNGEYQYCVVFNKSTPSTKALSTCAYNIFNVCRY